MDDSCTPPWSLDLRLCVSHGSGCQKADNKENCMKDDKNPGQVQKVWKVAKVLYVLSRIWKFVMYLASDYFKKTYAY